MTRLKVAVLFGGQSVEHEVSLRSARAVIAALDPELFEPVPVAVTRTGRWWTGDVASALLQERASAPEGRGDRILVPDPSFGGLAGPSGGGGWGALPIDVAFPLIHGGQGEDGTLQGLLELAGIPYVGSGVTASALGMDKRMQRRLFRAAGLPVLPTVEVHRDRWQAGRAEERRRVLEGVGVPCFLKPACGGSSVGVGKAHTGEEIDDCVADAARYDSIVLAEPAVEARELECAVLGNRDARAAGPGEVIPGREFYDYRAKYLEDTSQLLVRAPVDAETAGALRRMAVQAFECLGCAGLARVDFFLDRDSGKLWLNEINTLPGFTSISMYPRLWREEGMDLPALVRRLVDLALEQHRDRGRNQRLLPTAGG